MFNAERTLRGLRIIAGFIGLLSLAFGLAVLVVGWWLDVRGVRQPFGTQAPLRPNTAACLVTAGLGVAATAAGAQRLITIGAGVVTAVVGAVTTAEFAVGATSTGFDLILHRDLSDFPTPVAGRMGVNSAVAFLVLGVALILLGLGRAAGVRQSLAVAGALVGYIAVLGFISDTSWLDAVDPAATLARFSQMSLQAAIPVTLLGVAITIVSPRSGWGRIMLEPSGGGRVFRIFMPVVVVVSVIGAVVYGIIYRAGASPGAAASLLLGWFTAACVIMLIILSRTVQNGFEQLRAAEAQARHESERLARSELQIIGFQEAERIKDEFISTVSHELRTPLTSIRGSLGLIEGGAMGQIPAKAMSMVRIANSNTDRLIRLINDVMDLEKMRSGKIEMRRQPMSLTDAAAVAIADVEGAAEAATVELVLAAADPAPAVIADHDRLVQLVVNLLSNAIKFSPPRTAITVSVRGSDQGRHEGTDPPASRALISVTDHGPGIPSDKAAAIFDRFTQLDQSAARGKPGTGLGLAIARDIAELHGGTLTMTSELGHGATFTFEMPSTGTWDGTPAGSTQSVAAADVPAAGSQAPAADSSAAPTTRPRLLVVEDDTALSTVYGALLTGAGYDVRLALSLAQAREQLATEAPDAVLLDVRLRDGSGLDLLSELADDERYSSTTVIVISGSADQPSGSLPLVVDWIRKPADNLQLLSRLALDLAGVGKPRVLVIEDDHDTAEVVAELVRQIGCVPHISPDGRQALQHVATNRIDLIILDVGLPIMDGYDFVTALSRIGNANVPIVVYTGRDLTPEQRSRLSLGLTSYLTKTQSSEADLQLAVSEALGRALDGPAGAAHSDA